jgi:AraC family transcriptional regulator
MEAGYDTHEAFTRSFRAMFDASPTEFRESRRLTAAAGAASAVHFDPEGRVASFTSPSLEHDMNVTIEDIQPMRVAFIRHNGPYNECGPAWQKLFAWAFPQGLVGPASTILGVCHDDPEVTPPERIRYDVCITAPESVKPSGEIGAQDVGGGPYAVYRHTGPYEELGDVYLKLCGQWLPHSGRELRSAPTIEFYRNSPMDTPPEKLITDVCLPLEPV